MTSLGGWGSDRLVTIGSKNLNFAVTSFLNGPYTSGGTGVSGFVFFALFRCDFCAVLFFFEKAFFLFKIWVVFFLAREEWKIHFKFKTYIVRFELEVYFSLFSCQKKQFKFWTKIKLFQRRIKPRKNRIYYTPSLHFTSTPPRGKLLLPVCVRDLGCLGIYRYF